MKKWAKIAVGAAAVMLIGATVWRRWPSREPMYNGRAVREYLLSNQAMLFASVGLTDPEEDEALSRFGTNAAPCIRAALRTKDTWDRGALVWVAHKLPWLRIRVRTAYEEHLLALVAYDRIVRLGCWGAARADCESEVRALTSDPKLGGTANQVLVDIKIAPFP